jgi:hypothetical protein
LIVFLFVSPFAAIVGVFYGIPDQYTQTYVGELEDMFDRLNSIQEKKIIVVGGSSVTFGLRSDLVEQELNMPCVDFGLYGTIGTKAMMDLSKSNIGEGDIVILAPETARQSMSLYFNPDAMLRAVNGNNAILRYLTDDNKLQMINELPGYLSTNYQVYTGEASVSLSGVYQKSSFNEYCDISYPRPYNVMDGLYDPVATLDLSEQEGDKEFIDYVNDYAAFVRSRGAEVYFDFCPINSMCMKSGEDEIKRFEDMLFETIDMEIIGNMEDYIMDPLLFYDTNFHCNEAGVIYRTVQLINDIKRAQGDNSPTNIELPDLPAVPEVTPPETNTPTTPTTPSTGTENNSDVDCFIYQMNGTTYAIVGLSDEGMEKSELVVPASYEGVAVTSIFSKAICSTALRKITVPVNIKNIQNEAFKGCTKLTAIYIAQTEPMDITVGMAGGLLEGVNETCKIYVPQASLSRYQSDYTWEFYRSYLRGY